MSTFFQNPDFETTFDEITAGVARVSPWQAMFDEAEETLGSAHPEGFEVEEIGRTAFESLPESDRDEALDQLFYAYWSARENDREELARHEQERDARDQLKGALFLYRLASDCPAPVSYELLADIARLTNQLMGGAA